MEGSGNGESRERESKKARGWGKTPSTGSEKCWLPICNSIRSRPGRADPEIYFRIVHAAKNGPNCAPVAAYREQMVEIALGPKGAFENGNIGALRRRMLSDKVVSAVLPSRGDPKPLPRKESHQGSGREDQRGPANADPAERAMLIPCRSGSRPCQPPRSATLAIRNGLPPQESGQVASVRTR